MSVDIAAVRTIIANGLPLKAGWRNPKMPVEFDFTIGHQGLQPFGRSFVNFEPTEKRWFDLLVFGEEDYAEGGGASPLLCVDKNDAGVYGLDVERDRGAIFLLNSSIDRYVATFSYLHGYLGTGRDVPPDVETQLGVIDPVAYSQSEWRDLARALLEPG